MDDQNRQRLEQIAVRYVGRPAEPVRTAGSTSNAGNVALLSSFQRMRDRVLRPAMKEVGRRLRATGCAFEIRPGGGAGEPAVEFLVALPHREETTAILRVAAQRDDQRGWQVVAEVEHGAEPVEVARFDATDEVTANVAERLILDAVERMFAPPLVGAVPVSSVVEVGVFETRQDREGHREDGRGDQRAGVDAPRSPAAVAAELPGLGVPIAEGDERLDLREAIDAALPFQPEAAPAPRMADRGSDAAASHPEDRLDPQLAAVMAKRRASAHLAETSDMDLRAILSTLKSDPLPFIEGRSALQVPVAGPARDTRVGSGTVQADFRAMLAMIDARPLPFAAARGHAARGRVNVHPKAELPFSAPDGPPHLTFEEYATFRARLSLEGEDRVDVWKDFGITSQAAKDALQARFAALFRTDPSAQAHFIELVQRRVSELRERATRR